MGDPSADSVACPRCGVESTETGVCSACLLGLILSEGTGEGEEGHRGGSFEELAYHGHGLAILGQVGQGGMGVVYEAEQLPLGRLVALKVLREEHRDNLELRARFDEESRIGARLQHPGVVPVYQSGTLGDLPFFTMRRVLGRSFAELLREDPPLSRSMEIFRQVCQTLAYAHDQGVVHRDLKPANVMVGDFGEVILLDWGMASGVDSDPLGRALVLGTPPYMSPEQARGGPGTPDERSDVFGLGAMLCEVLTGCPPYSAETVAEVRRKAVAADLADAFQRLDAAGVDPELRALAKACLDPDPTRRPPQAGEVARSLTEYEAGVRARLQAAEQARWQAEGRADGERRRRWLAVTLLAVCAGTALWYVNGRAAESRRELAREQVIENALREAGRLRSLGRTAEARASAEVARGVLVNASELLRRRTDRRLADLETLSKLEDARFSPGQAGDPRLASARAEAYAAALSRFGIDPDKPDLKTMAPLIRNLPIREEILVALDDWARASRDPDQRARLRALATAADPDSLGVRARLRKALADRDRTALLRLAKAEDLARQPAAVLVSLGATLREAGAAADSVSVLRQAEQVYPSDFLVNLELAAAHGALEPPDSAGSKAYLTAALALSGRNPGVYFYLGQSQHQANKLPEAVAAYREAIALKPDYAEAYNNLGNALTALGKTTEAVAAFEKAIQHRENYALAYFNLGFALDNLKDDEASSRAYRKAIAAKPDYAEAYCNLGLAEYRLGSFGNALTDLEKGIALIPVNDPKRPTWLQLAGLARSLSALEPKLEKVLAGGPPPADAAETVGLARLCAWKNRQLHARAAQYYADAFQADPGLAENLVVGDRYNAAGSAILAGTGKGRDADALTPEERSAFRAKALAWLRADMALRASIIQGADPAAAQRSRALLRYWKSEPNFEGVRNAEALTALPSSDRLAWEALWDELERLSATPKP